ncbi:MAG TPA: response regulator transcription factor [Flavobacterium sp.]|nr:response regulator transcription factor [Flavobacterium sp.]
MIHIALVDDHQMFLDGMISVLSGQKSFDILFVENHAQKALEKLKECVPDIIITDISMPEMNGIEFIRIVKKSYPEVKILVVSMFDNLQSIENIDGYLLKETDKQELIDAINSIVLDNKKYYGNQNNHIDTFEFKKSILTQREKQIIRLIAEEYTTDAIADQLAISKGTIETHRKNIFFKLQVKNIAGLIKKAIYLGIIK